MERYVGQAQAFCPPTAPFQWRKGVTYVGTELFWPFDPTQKLYSNLDENGVIIYRFKPNVSPVLQPIPVDLPVPVDVLQRVKDFIGRVAKVTGEKELKRLAYQMFDGMERIEIRTIMSGAVAGTIAAVAAKYYSRANIPVSQIATMSAVVIVVGWDILYGDGNQN